MDYNNLNLTETKAFNDGYDAYLGGQFHCPNNCSHRELWLIGWNAAKTDLQSWSPSVIEDGFRMTSWHDLEIIHNRIVWSKKGFSKKN